MIAIDTNILVHAHRQEAVFHQQAAAVVRSTAEGAAAWRICYHTLVEFFSVSTNPKIWQNPSTPKQIERQISFWLESPSSGLLLDQAQDLRHLLDLAQHASLAGAIIHDARIANCCILNGVSELWTIDRDFSRFPKLKTRNPLL